MQRSISLLSTFRRNFAEIGDELASYNLKSSKLQYLSKNEFADSRIAIRQRIAQLGLKIHLLHYYNPIIDSPRFLSKMQ